MQPPPRPPLLEHDDIKDLSEAEWLSRLLRSVQEPVIDGRFYPRFPDVGLQRAFVGSDSAAALEEGFRFYSYLQHHLRDRRFEVKADRYLDFGSAWGRISRIFLRDFPRGEMVGVDVDQGMVAFCHNAGVPGAYFTIGNASKLPFADASFRLTTGYSVFSHLPERLFRHWIDELLRVSAPGALIAFTVEPERFLDFVAGIDRANPPSGWHAALAEAMGEVEARRRELHRKGFTFIPTGGGPYRAKDVYGDTVVTPAFVDDCLGGRAEVVAWVDDPEKFWQAVVVVRKHRWNIPFRRRTGR